MDVEPQQRIKIEVGIDDLCDIIDVAQDALRGDYNFLDYNGATTDRLLAVLRDLDRQIDAGGVR